MPTTLKIIDREYRNTDPVRGYYSLGGRFDQFGRPLQPGIDSLLGSIEHSVQIAPSEANDGIDTKVESVTLSYPPSFSEEMINNVINEINNNSYLTHKCAIIIPDEDNSPDNFNYNTYQNDAFSYYNLRNEEYENLTANVLEKHLPNFCLGALWNGTLQRSPSREAEQREYYSMFGAIPSMTDTPADLLAGETPINNYEFDDEYLSYSNVDPQLETKKDYFKNYTASGSFTPEFLDYHNANSHVYVDFHYNSLDSGQIGNVPFFNRIRLPASQPSPSSLPNDLFSTAEKTTIHRSQIVQTFEESFLTDRLMKSFRTSNSSTREFFVNNNVASLKVYDLFDLYASIGYGRSIREPDEMYLRSIDQNFSTTDHGPFVFYFNKLLLLGKIRQMFKEHRRNFEQLIVEGKNHHTEHVGFKVVKRASGRSTPIQTFYFLNRRGLQDFIDTQVKFDKVYTYTVTGIFGIFGTEYSYENIFRSSSFDGRKRISFTFNTTPSVKLVEIELALHTLRIVEPPPIVPEVTFYNEITSKNKIKIRLEHQDGNIVDEYSKKPMMVFGNNETYIGKLNQYFASPDVLVQSGKTSDGVYEVYRIDYPPKSYSDFENNLLTTVESQMVFRNGEKSRNVMMVDMIKHQKKYYYCFRALTHRGNPSHLSQVYVVETYEDADETFLTFDLYQPENPENFQKSISMRKYIQILPNFGQTIANDLELLSYSSAQAAMPHLKLGNPELKNLWEYNKEDKYIKLRLESTNSGRKIDLNLFFEIKKPN